MTRPHPAALPDASGHFGRFGGRFVPETLMAPLIELERAYRAARRDARFRSRLRHLLTRYAGRPTPLYLAERLYGREVSERIGQGLVIEWKLADLRYRQAPGALLARPGP